MVEIRHKMQVVYKELTRDWVKSKVAKKEFYSLKSQNAGELHGKFAISRIKFMVSFFFQWGWIKRLEYVIKFSLQGNGM